AIAEAVLITRFSFFDWQPFHGVNHIDLNTIDEVYFLEIQVFYEPRHSRTGPRLASNDEGDARPDEVCSRWYCRDRARPFGFRRAGSPAAQGAFARQYDRPDRRSDPRLDQYRCRPPRREGPGQPGRERRRPTRADRRPDPVRQGPHCWSLSKAFRA